MRAPLSYLEASQEEKDAVCNGCGSKGIGGYIVPDTLWGLSITDDCNVHDWMYYSGKTQADKDHADNVFYCNVCERIDESSMWFKPMRKIRAKLYYFMVSKWGDDAFWHGKENR